MALNIEVHPYGTAGDGTAIQQIILRNKQGLQAHFINYGATLICLLAPDRQGDLESVVLGYNNLAAYEREPGYLGATIGRFANRIGNARFYLDGVAHNVYPSDGKHALHGGQNGFDKRIWQFETRALAGGAAVDFYYESAHLEEGFPGSVNVRVSYALTKDNELDISYLAESRQKTIVNLTHHSYFNLSGFNLSALHLDRAGRRATTSGITNACGLEQRLMIDADHILATDKSLIPTGEYLPVKETGYDFRQPKLIARAMQMLDRTLGGYDINYVLNKESDKFARAATLYHEQSGRHMEVWTNQPGVQFYSGNHFSAIAGGNVDQGSACQFYKHAGICLECQHFPDSPNHADFPSTVIDAERKYKYRTVYKFSVQA